MAVVKGAGAATGRPGIFTKRFYAEGLPQSSFRYCRTAIDRQEQTGSGEPPTCGAVAEECGGLAFLTMSFVAFILVFLTGLGSGIAFRRHRAFDAKRAINARDYLLAVAEQKVKILAHEVVLRDQTISNIKTIARRAHIDRFLALGGTGSLPAPANQSGQRVTERMGAQIVKKAFSGSSQNGGSAFLKRAS